MTPAREVLAGGPFSPLTKVSAGVGLLGLAAGVVGVFVLLRKRSLVSDTLAHAMFPGVALAFIAGSLLRDAGVAIDPRSLAVLLTGATLTGLAGVAAVQAIRGATRLTEDAALGIVLSVGFGLGVVAFSGVQQSGLTGAGGIRAFIKGQAAAMSDADIAVTAAAALLVIAGCGLLFKEFRLMAFDRLFAASQGWPTGWLDSVLLAMLVLVAVVGLQSVGLILIVAMLVTPAVTARLWSQRLRTVIVLAAAFGGAAGYAGAVVSSLAPGLPTGPVIVLTQGALLGVGLLVAPRRGLIAVSWRHVRLRLRIGREHLLRAVYELGELRARGTDSERTPGELTFSLTELGRRRARVPLSRRLDLWLLRLSGLVRPSAASARGPAGTRRFALTDAGAREAARVTRNHRLWEQYLVRFAEASPSHVDRSADLIEHALGPGLVRELEAALRASGGAVPSPHELSPPAIGGGR